MGLFDFLKKKTDDASNAAQNIGSGVSDAADKVGETISAPGEAVKNVVDAAKDAASSVADAADTVTDKIPGQLDDKVVDAVTEKLGYSGGDNPTPPSADSGAGSTAPEGGSGEPTASEDKPAEGTPPPTL